MSKFHSVRDDFLFCFGLDQLVTAVVVEGWAHVETLLGSVVPWLAIARFAVDKHPAAHGG